MAIEARKPPSQFALRLRRALGGRAGWNGVVFQVLFVAALIWLGYEIVANARANCAAVGVFAPEQLPPGAYDVVLANILAQPLVLLAPLLAARTRAGGRIVLSGILQAQAEEVAAAYAPHFEVRIAGAEEGWSLVQGTRR